MISEPSTVLVIAAHPDDEVLGDGATIAHHPDSGDIVHMLTLADCATSKKEQLYCDKVDNELTSLVEPVQLDAVILNPAAV